MSSLTATQFEGKRILVIDDEARLAHSLAALLRGAGYQVMAATTGSEGLERLREDSFDLVISDLRMDGVDGFDIMHHLAEHSRSTPLIVITGHASMSSAIEALHQRVADYITKPFDFDVLRGSIERVFAQQETERLRADLIHMLTHDIKVPLTNILGFAQLIERDESTRNTPVRQYSQIIMLNSQRVIGMLDNYLTNARVEEGRLEPYPTPVNPAELIDEALHLTSLEFQRKEISVSRDYKEVPFPVQTDEHLLSRAIANIVSNAAKYTPHGEKVHAEVAPVEGDERVRITIANSGVTLSAEEAETIFQRYCRSGSSRGTDGTGLGLHVVRCIVQAHGGEARCDSRDNWVRFTLTLPADPQVEE